MVDLAKPPRDAAVGGKATPVAVSQTGLDDRYLRQMLSLADPGDRQGDQAGKCRRSGAARRHRSRGRRRLETLVLRERKRAPGASPRGKPVLGIRETAAASPNRLTTDRPQPHWGAAGPGGSRMGVQRLGAFNQTPNILRGWMAVRSGTGIEQPLVLEMESDPSNPR